MTTQNVILKLSELDTNQAASCIEEMSPELSAKALRQIAPQLAQDIVSLVPEQLRENILSSLGQDIRQQWECNAEFAEDSIGRMMEPVWAVFSPDVKVSQTIEALREIVKKEFITYAYVIDATKKLIGVIVMRDLLFADHQSTLQQIMLKEPFSLRASTSLLDAMREVLTRHYPVYPVSNDQGQLVGLVRGQRLFEAQSIEISAQAGSMVGVEKEERLSTPWTRSFKYRHPWLQLNLLTAFLAGGVVSLFQDTINQVVVIAAFLPVLAGQSGNTGCQALAVTIRGITMRELKQGGVKKLLFKEGLLGFFNGVFVGVSAAVGMYILASTQGNPDALVLSLIVMCAMIASCLVSGLSGALIPLTLRRLGADPATASSIFLTTATDVASMGLLLSLATWLLM